MKVDRHEENGDKKKNAEEEGQEEEGEKRNKIIKRGKSLLYVTSIPILFRKPSVPRETNFFQMIWVSEV
jgi:hypothetical protein